jgi:hypothetical protein
VFILGRARAQEKVYFPYFEMINVENGDGLQLSTSKLLKAYIEESHNIQVIIPEKDHDGLYPREDFLKSIENAKQAGAKYLLTGEINNIGKLAILSMSLYEVSSGNKIWNDLIKGLPLDDYDPVLSRIGRNFGTGIKAKDDADIYDVTAFEEQREMKLLNFTTNQFFGIGLGGNYIFNESLNTKIGANFFYDISSVILYMNFEYSSNVMFNFILDPEWRHSDILKTRTGAMGLGVSFPFTKTKNAFYAETGLQLGIFSQKGNNPAVNRRGSGLEIPTAVGYLIGRNSTTNIRFYTGMTFPTYNSGDKYTPVFKFGIITSFISFKGK